MIVKVYSAEAEAFQRKFTFPYEEWIFGIHRHREWPGGYRWFRSENVVAIEAYKRVRNTNPDPGFRKTG